MPKTNVEQIITGDKHSETTSYNLNVTKKDFENFQSNVEARLDKLEKPPEDASPLDSMAGYISVAAIFLALIGVIVLLLVRNALLGKTNKLTEKFKEQSETIDQLQSRISSLENKIFDLESKNRAQEQELKKILSSPPPEKMVTLKKSSPTEKILSSPPPPPEKYLDFVRDFNALNIQSGYDYTQSSTEFLRKYGVQGFSCTNLNQRMNEPVPDPQFSETPPQNADFWAYEFEPGIYAVVPKIKTYTDNYHSERASGEIFQSNFKQGGIYNKIRVIKPAIFKGKWNLEKHGVLELE